ncbi:MAG: SDR family oxidoreductase [bacterium]|nr:SDR family oxidoreductase [bacterium]
MKKRIMIFGGTGMLGHCLFTQYLRNDKLDVYATALSIRPEEKWFESRYKKRLVVGVDAEDFTAITHILEDIKPDIVINCIAFIRQSQIESYPLATITVNAQFPHRLALACQKTGARLIQISSDVVFDGKKGMYVEQDKKNISDFYGMTKFLGEVSYPNCVTIRTSIIGHELLEKVGLVEWFLGQKEKVRGYTNVIYSGLPTVELARVIIDYILPHKELSGVYHVSSAPIAKYDLLRLIAAQYGKQIEIEPYAGVMSDRSLDSSQFRSLTGYNPPSWEELVNRMYNEHNEQK